MLALDVVEDILLTLDVKDLLLWKSVCKSWYSLISSPLFVKLHLKFIRNNEDKNNKQLRNRRIAMIRGYYYTSNIEGCSNGLVCISSVYNDRICFTNPSTREVRILQNLPIPPTYVTHAQCYGFGYDSSIDDYKLVLAIDQGSKGTLVHILSLKSNVWKLFGHVNYRFDENDSPGILLNEALHWFWYYTNNINKKYIMCFDLAKEEFREIPQPEDMRYDESHTFKLGIFEDHLCIFHICLGGRPSDIWVMKNYHVKQYWELLPTYCKMKDRVHNMHDNCRLFRKTPSYFCCDALLSSSGKHMSDPIFVQALVSPYVDNERPSGPKNNKRTVKSARHKGKRKKLMTQKIEGEGGKKKRTRNKNNSQH